MYITKIRLGIEKLFIFRLMCAMLFTKLYLNRTKRMNKKKYKFNILYVAIFTNKRIHNTIKLHVNSSLEHIIHNMERMKKRKRIKKKISIDKVSQGLQQVSKIMKWNEIEYKCVACASLHPSYTLCATLIPHSFSRDGNVLCLLNCVDYER